MSISVTRLSRPTLGLAARAALCIAGGAIMAVNIRTFVSTGELLPGGFVGLALLIRETLARFAGLRVPFGLLYMLLNAVPVALSWRLVGHRYTALSCLAILVASVLAEVLPERTVVGDPVLLAVFGGLVQGLSITICLQARATSGGTDFVAVLLARRWHLDGWAAVLYFNAAVLLCAGALFGWEHALWSIVFQFVSTQTIRTYHTRYKRHTVLAVTDRPEEVAEFIRRETRHGATRVEAAGAYSGTPHRLVYSVVDSDEVSAVVRGIREIDPKSFVNAFRTDIVSGHWYERPED